MPGTVDIRYLDHVDTEALRDRYRSHAGFDIEAIVPIDYASGGRSIQCTVGPDAPFAYVIASHVIEHVPDLIAWLTDVRSVLMNDGVVSLAVPDHRRCFDVLRTPTAAAEVVEAHLLAATMPSPRQVFDHHISARSWGGQIAWSTDPALEELHPVHPVEEAMERATAAAAGHYDDVHCWVFTPQSFVDLFAELQALALVPFDVVSCSGTEGGEFFVVLPYRPVRTEGVEPRSRPSSARSWWPAARSSTTSGRNATRCWPAGRGGSPHPSVEPTPWWRGSAPGRASRKLRTACYQ